MFVLFYTWFQVRVHCFRIQDSGKRLSIIFLLPGNWFFPNHKSEGTPPCTFKRSGVNVWQFGVQCSSKVFSKTFITVYSKRFNKVYSKHFIAVYSTRCITVCSTWYITVYSTSCIKGCSTRCITVQCTVQGSLQCAVRGTLQCTVQGAIQIVEQCS